MPHHQVPAILHAQQHTDYFFYVRPSEWSNSGIVTPHSIGSKCIAWSRSLQHALCAKNKLAFIDGSLPILDLDDLNRGEWKRCNHLIQSWILNFVSPQIAQTLIFHIHAIDFWEELKERFFKADIICISTLRSLINNLKQRSYFVLNYCLPMFLVNYEGLVLVITSKIKPEILGHVVYFVFQLFVEFIGCFTNKTRPCGRSSTKKRFIRAK